MELPVCKIVMIDSLEDKIDGMLTLVSLLGCKVELNAGIDSENDKIWTNIYSIFADKLYEIGFGLCEDQIDFVYLAVVEYEDIDDCNWDCLKSIDNPNDDQIDEIINVLIEKIKIVR